MANMKYIYLLLLLVLTSCKYECVCTAADGTTETLTYKGTISPAEAKAKCDIQGKQGIGSCVLVK